MKRSGTGTTPHPGATKTAHELANRSRQRSLWITLISTTSHQAGHEPAKLSTTTLASLTSFHDEDRRRFKISEPTSVVRSMDVSVTVKTERPEITVRLTGQAFIRAVMQVNLLVGPARCARPVVDRVVPPFTLGPLGRLQVPAIRLAMPRAHGSHVCGRYGLMGTHLAECSSADPPLVGATHSHRCNSFTQARTRHRWSICVSGGMAPIFCS